MMIRINFIKGILPWSNITIQKTTVKTVASMLLLEDDDALATFIFFKAFIRSILARFNMASSVISLISFWSAASNDGARGGLGGFGDFLLLDFLRFSFSGVLFSAYSTEYNLFVTFTMSIETTVNFDSLQHPLYLSSPFIQSPANPQEILVSIIFPHPLHSYDPSQTHN